MNSKKSLIKRIIALKRRGFHQPTIKMNPVHKTHPVHKIRLDDLHPLSYNKTDVIHSLDANPAAIRRFARNFGLHGLYTHLNRLYVFQQEVLNQPAKEKIQAQIELVESEMERLYDIV